MAQKKRVRVKMPKKKKAPGVTVVVQEAQPVSRTSAERKKRRRNKVAATRHGGTHVMGLSHCAVKYAAAVARPFSAEANGACLPFPPDRDSLKVSAYARFSLTADASGNAFVLVAPCLANDYKAVWYNSTTGTVPCVVAGTNTAPANYAAAAFTTQPFNATTLISNACTGRIVSVGIRITYTGTAANMAGTYYAYQEPSHGNLNTAAYSSSTVYGALETKVKRVDRMPYEQGFTIVRPSEQNYVGTQEYRQGASGNVNALYPWSTTDMNNRGPADAGYILNGSPPIIFGVIGAVAASTFFVEVVQHSEFTGKDASWGLTPSHNDHNAANLITAAADRSQGDFVGRPEEAWSGTFMRNFRKIFSGMDEVGGDIAGLAVRAGMRQLAMRQRGALLLQ